MIYHLFAPFLLGLLGERGTNTKLCRVYSEQPLKSLQERHCCQSLWVSCRRAEFADYLEMISVWMSHAGDILCTNKKDNMQLRIIRMLLAKQAQVYRINVHLHEEGRQGR